MGRGPRGERLAKEAAATAAVPKEFRPSCGSAMIYDGRFANGGVPATELRTS